jgi:Xaa-Pro aminopeptidase
MINPAPDLIAACARRRQRLAAAIGEGIAIIPTAAEKVRNRDAHFPYRFDSYFYYLTGFREPDSVLVIEGGDKPKSTLFCRQKNEAREIWDGFRYGPEKAAKIFGLDCAQPIDALDGQMPDLLADRESVYVHLGDDAVWDGRVLSWINAVRGQMRSGVAAPDNVRDVRRILDDMRLVKDMVELETMRRAAAISVSAHREAMRVARPGLHEFAVEAELLRVFRRAGAQAPAYTSIVAGGANACVLHYVDNDNLLRDGDLLLIDAGAEVDGYAADITRTFPVNGRFSGPQRDVYALVLAAQAAAVATVKPGTRWNAPHDAAVRVLSQGMIDLGLLSGSIDSVIEQESYKRFYMHRTGHWLGLDVHDAGSYKRDGEWTALQAGMVLTVEPGCYIRPGDDIPAHFHDIGVRIEDDALVTAEGCELLTAGAPKSIADVESWMRAR